MKTAADLQKILKEIDHRGYPAYKETKGTYVFDGYILSIDHVQGDPFAAPSKVSIHMKGQTAGFPEESYTQKERRIALQDYLLRIFAKTIDQYSFKAKGSGKSGLLVVSRCGQEVLERTACTIDPKNGSIVIRLEIGFPANGRSICSFELQKILFEFLPASVKNTLFYKKLHKTQVEEMLFLADDRQFIRERLFELGLVAFVADGSVLPRETGVSDRPMKECVPFLSPESMKTELILPHKGKITGMGIRKGITLIVGGGYHGKSTLLKALEMGVYNHIGGDGREYVITVPDAVKIRAEDGRSVVCDDISLFVNHLPNGKDTVQFHTEDASGSTSQAANVVEAIESSASLLLIDEDTCATNFMVRDELMQRVVCREQEPITPFIERARLLYEQEGISSMIVAGSSGCYFHISDCILQMDHYHAKEITAFAKEEAKAFPLVKGAAERKSIPDFVRRPIGRHGDQDRIKVKGMGKDAVILNKETIDLHSIEQIADSEQATAIGYLLAYAEANFFNGKYSLVEIVDKLEEIMDTCGMTGIVGGNDVPTGLALPRRQEIFAGFNRYRKLKCADVR